MGRYIDSIIAPEPEPTWEQLTARQRGEVEVKRQVALVEAARVVEELAQQEVAKQRLLAERRVVQPSEPVTVSGNDNFATLRMCESGGNYTTNTGNGYYGAYQYDIPTWGNYGGYSRPDLAPPSVQDAKAHETQAARGWSPWPSCARQHGLLGDARSELTGSIGYAQAGGNCVDEIGVNNPGWGNPSDWPATSSTPWVGATVLFHYNHTGIITGIWDNGDIEIRHQNWSGAPQTRFPASEFRGYR